MNETRQNLIQYCLLLWHSLYNFNAYSLRRRILTIQNLTKRSQNKQMALKERVEFDLESEPIRNLR